MALEYISHRANRLKISSTSNFLKNQDAKLRDIKLNSEGLGNLIWQWEVGCRFGVNGQD